MSFRRVVFAPESSRCACTDSFVHTQKDWFWSLPPMEFSTSPRIISFTEGILPPVLPPRPMSRSRAARACSRNSSRRARHRPAVELGVCEFLLVVDVDGFILPFDDTFFVFNALAFVQLQN